VFVRRYVHFVAKHPELGRVVVIEAYKPSERARWLLQTHVLPTLGLAVAMIEDAQRRGLVKDIPARQIAAMLNGAVNVYFNEEVMRRRLAGEDGAVEFDDDEIDRFADSLLETFSYGLIVA